jgi:D-alanyl-D-alanine carboxypeptidase (penicillin-binding protein 5/6)
MVGPAVAGAAAGLARLLTRAAAGTAAVVAALAAAFLHGPAAAAASAAPTASVTIDPAAPMPTGVGAASWLVADADGGEILASRGARVRDLPASTLKILTALVVLPGLSPDLRVAVGADAADVQGTRVGLVPSQTYTVRELATAMLIASGNDATTALVDAAGGRPAVVARMNRLAASLGATDTVAVDPTGLDAPGQLTSVRDLAILGRAALAQPVVSQYLTIPRAQLPGRGGRTFEIQNHNMLLGRYAGTLGVKNGYTVAADATYVGAVHRGGRTLLVALLRAAPDYAVDARILLDWGFANAEKARPVGMLPAPPPPVDDTAAHVDDATATVGSLRAPGSPVGAGAAHGGGLGVGWFTWVALAATVAAAALMGLAERRTNQVRRARRRHRHGGGPNPGHPRPTRTSARFARPVPRAPRPRSAPRTRHATGRHEGPADRSPRPPV